MPPDLAANVSSCKLHFITVGESIQTSELALEDAFSNQQFNVPGTHSRQEVIAMIDAMGIPNVVTMKIGDNLQASIDSRIRKDSFAGVRIDSDVWESHQTGFVFNPELFNSDPRQALETQKIYLRNKSEDPQVNRGDLVLRFSLPFGRQNSPVTSDADFSYVWNRGSAVELNNPTLRNHFIETEDFSFISTVRRHEYRARNVVADIDDIPLNIYWGPPENQGRMIGNWSFTTSNPNNDDNIRISPELINRIATKVRLDFSSIRPYCSDMKAGIGEAAPILIEDLPDVFRSTAPGNYEFEIKDLAKALQIDLNSLIREKTAAGGGTINMSLIVETVDFFGKTLNQRGTIRLIAPKPRPRPVEEKKPKDDGQDLAQNQPFWR